MRYFSLKYSRNRKEVGKKPQSQGGLLGDIQQDFMPWHGPINFDFKLPEPRLEKGAKQVSFLNVAFIHPNRFLVFDDNLLNYLKKIDVGKHQTWKIKTWQNQKLIEKYNLFLISDTKQNAYIDFSKSEFFTKKLGDWNNSSIRQSVLVKDYNSYNLEKERLRKDRLMLLHSKVTLDLRKANEDMFRIINAPLGGYFVSERLKIGIEENGFTGMEFIEVSELDKVKVIY